MMDSRRLVRGAALQALYELDTTLHRQEDVLRFRGESILDYDVRLLGFLALRQYSATPDNQPESLNIQLNKPSDLRDPIEQILIDYLTEGQLEEDIMDEHVAELERLLLVSDTEEFDLRPQSPADLLPLEDQKQVNYLVSEIWKERTVLDKMIHLDAPEWPISQIAVVDRNILRIAIFEFAMSKETPASVAINEAVELAKIFGSENAPRFVNGVLGAVYRRSNEIPKESLP
jgi:transcription antitermination factor NusB